MGISISKAMVKNMNKKKNDSASMDITEEPVSDLPQAMDTFESGAHTTQVVVFPLQYIANT
ncbi:hypothetical protein Prudu_297S000100 [Prunus dulcis]|uniref:Uncharacterized protein n=1 Tax=Prunus dulcis TaxID=3755 RepID=A0A5H2XMI9_PRUDU|nr:hypothetical protein Prudu_297S000100 [Prunus dulcis]